MTRGLLTRGRDLIATAWTDRSLATKFIIAYALVGLLIVSTLVWRSGTQIARAIEEEMEHELELRALIIASTLQSDVEDMAEHGRTPRQVLTLMRQLGEGTDTRISFYDRSLNLIFSTDQAVKPHTAERTPEIEAALASQEQHDIRWDPWTNQMRLYVAAPVHYEQEVLGVVQLSIPWARVQSRINAEWSRLILAGVLAVLGNVIVSFWLARGIARPLQQLAQAARDIAGGRLDRRAPVRGRDEVGSLAVAFNEMADRVQEMIARERLFIANASHELRSPLTSVKLRVEMLRDPNLPPDRRRRYIDEVYQEVEHLQQLANRLLDLTRLQMQPAREEREPVALDVVVEETVERFHLRAAKAGITLRYERPPNATAVAASEQGLREILENLLDNAIKYTPQGGRVTVSLAKAEGQVILEVADTGPGIPPEDLPHIFEPFYRVNKARDRQRGSGLGLTITKRLVELFGGEIHVQSALGQGTTFRVVLPSWPDGNPAVEAPASGRN